MLSFFLSQFLQKYFSYKKPLLLAYSGGGDSQALLQALLQCKKKKDFCLHLAHVDHGWRESSAKEALLLQKKAEEKGLIFHFARKPFREDKNLEASSRDFRYQFFSSLQKKQEYEAVLLAHHADDLAETVLKRVLEGARLFHLEGMKPISFFLNMKLFRPFLGFTKKDLENFLLVEKSSFLVDETNEDPHFLRTRLRKKIFPFLEKEFGKNPRNPLCFLSKQSSEMKQHLQEKVFPILKLAQEETPLVKILFIEKLPPLSRWETRYLLCCFFGKTLLRQEEERLLEAFWQRKQTFQIGENIFWNKKRLLWYKKGKALSAEEKGLVRKETKE